MPHDQIEAGTPAGEADRRTVRRVAALGAAAIAATALATAGVASAGTGPASPLATPAPGTPNAMASSSASASPSAAPQLHVRIAYQRTGHDLTLSFGFDGYVIEPLDANGNKLTFPTPAKRDIGLGELLDWGDGTNADAPIAGRRCPTPQEAHTIHQIADAYSVTKHYAQPGTYTINYTYFACGLTNGKISGTLTMNIPA